MNLKEETNQPVTIYRPHIFEYTSSEALYQSAYDLVEQQILDFQYDLGLSRILLAGGTTPMKLYQKLGKSPVINFNSLEIYQSDERYIDPNSPDSNQKQIIQNFGENIQKTSNYFFNTQLTAELAIKDYEQKLESLDGVWFDQAILGIGSDGHFASIFANPDYLSHTDRSAIITKAPSNLAVATRLSLTIESVLNSRQILVLLVGSNKRKVLELLINSDLKAVDFPAKVLLAHPQVKIFVCFE